MKVIKPNIYPLDRSTSIDDILHAILEELLFLNQSQKLFNPHHFEKTYKLSPGATLDITDDIKAINESGIIKLIQIRTNSENVIFELKIDAHTIVATPKNMVEWGLFGEKRNMFWILVYDNTVSPPNIKLCYNTDTVYTQGIKAKIINPTTENVEFFISLYRLIRR